MFEEILLPTDGSKGVRKAVDCVASIAQKYGSRVYVLFVAETVISGPMISYDVSDKVRQNILNYGKKVVERTRDELERHGVKGVECLVKEGHPAEIILGRSEEVDLIVMGTRGRRIPERAFMGSITREVLNLSQTPVLVVKVTSL